MSHEVREAVIEQLNITYVPEEDRLLLRIAMSQDAELSLWLTRRVVSVLWQQINDQQVLDMIAPQLSMPVALQNKQNMNTLPDLQSAFHDFAKDAALQQLNFSEQYQQRQTINKIPLLVHNCRISLAEVPHLELLCAHETVKLALNSLLLLALTGILKLAVGQAQWDNLLIGAGTTAASFQNSLRLH